MVPNRVEEEVPEIRCGCGTTFRLRWDEGPGQQTLFVHYCASGGVYAVHIECPTCKKHTEL